MSKYYRSVLNVLTPAFASTQSFNFDGVDDTFNLGNITALNGINSGSFSMWLKLDATGILGLFNQYGSGSDRLIYAFIWLAGGRIDIYISGNLAFRVSSNAVISALSTGQWFNLVITYDGSLATSTDRVKVFINTNELTGNIGGAASSFFSSTSDFIIGHYPSGTYLNGNVDEFAIFTNTLSSSDVTSIYNSGVPNDISSLNPVAWYRMGENSNYKSPQWLMPENSNKDKFSNYSYDFDGVDDFIDCGDADNLSFGDGSSDSAFSISSWLNMDNVVRFRILSKYDTSKEEYIFSTSSGRQLVLNLYSQNNSAVKIGRIGSTILTPYIGTWIHVCATYDGSGSSSGIKIYINGVRDDANNNNSGSYVAMQNNTAPLRIGSGASYFANGSIDETAIFNTELSASDVTSLYNSGTPTTLPSGAVAHYRMGEEATFSTNWTIPDQVGGNDGTSANMTIEGRVGNAPNSDNNAVSFNMTESDRETDVPS
jgi:hypothetical protein